MLTGSLFSQAAGIHGLRGLLDLGDGAAEGPGQPQEGGRRDGYQLPATREGTAGEREVSKWDLQEAVH